MRRTGWYPLQSSLQVVIPPPCLPYLEHLQPRMLPATCAQGGEGNGRRALDREGQVQQGRQAARGDQDAQLLLSRVSRLLGF